MLEKTINSLLKHKSTGFAGIGGLVGYGFLHPLLWWLTAGNSKEINLRKKKK